MPFGLAAMFLAAQGVPSARVVGGVMVCLVGARTAAMAFNRLADWSIDQRNPRTAVRSTLVSKTTAYATMIGGVLALVGGAWLAVRGQFDSWVPIVLGTAVGLWVAGFDLIYALQDREFDQKEGLKSFPAKFGEKTSLAMATCLHGLAVLGLGVAGSVS